MKMSFFNRFFAILLSVSLVWTSGGVLDAAMAAPDIFAGPSDLPQFQLQPPGQLGRVADYFNADTTGLQKSGLTQSRASVNAGSPKQLVILIQDLHAHYGVQKNIAGLLEFPFRKNFLLPPSIARRSDDPQLRFPAFALVVEGASGSHRLLHHGALP